MFHLFVDSLPFQWIFTLVGFLSIVTYLGPQVFRWLLYHPQNLKIKYGASWALVTGASSGIGKAITEKLASQDINVVMVALGDEVLETALRELQARFPHIEFRKVGLDLSTAAQPNPHLFLEEIKKATDDIDIRLLFNNAGFITTGMFHAVSLERNMANYHCNATSSVILTHHFIHRMLQRKSSSGQKRLGLVTFTSSGAAYLPSPMSSIYASTKAFLTTFASSLAAEVSCEGIDVVCVHPSPIDSRFYQQSGKMSVLELFKKTALPPRVIADSLFTAAGRFTVCDQGYFSTGVRLGMKVLDWSALVEVMKLVLPTNGDFKVMRQEANAKLVELHKKQ